MCTGAASIIKMKRNLSFKSCTATPTAFTIFTTFAVVSQALFFRIIKILCFSRSRKTGSIHAWITASDPTIIWGRTLFTSSLSLTNATSDTADRRAFSELFLSCCKNCFRVQPWWTATCPRFRVGDSFTDDSSMFMRTTILVLSPWLSRKLLHRHVAKAWTGPKKRRTKN